MESNKKRILIIEDEQPMLQALSDKFKEENFNILIAKDGEEGLEQALKEHPDIILLDILMPKINGLEMLKKLRQTEWGSKVPVIMLTNVNPSTDSTLSAISQNQPAFYLIKSDVTLETVVSKVQEVLNPHS